MAHAPKAKAKAPQSDFGYKFTFRMTYLLSFSYSYTSQSTVLSVRFSLFTRVSRTRESLVGGRDGASHAHLRRAALYRVWRDGHVHNFELELHTDHSTEYP